MTALGQSDAEFTATMRAQGRDAMADRFGPEPSVDANVYQDLDWTLAELAAVEAEAARIDARKRELREVVASFMAETDARTIERPLAKVMMVAGSPRISYDHKALDTLCRDDSDLAFRLAPYRRETTTAPACRITWVKAVTA